MKSKVPTIRFKVYQEDKVIREDVFQQKSIRIGKSGQAHLRLRDPNVSRQHAVVELVEGGEVRITDLESTNGTCLNGQRVTQAVLRSGDELVLGTTKLIVEIEDEGEERPASETYFRRPAVQEEELTGKTVLEVVLLWNEELVTIQHFTKAMEVKIGETPRCSVSIPADYLGERDAILAMPRDSTFALRVVFDKAEGECLVGGKVYKVSELVSTRKLVDGCYLPMEPGTRARLRFGPFTIMASLSRIPAVRLESPLRRLGPQDHVYSAFSLVLHLLFLVLVMLIPEEQLHATRDPYERRVRAFKLLQVAELERKAREELARKEREKQRKHNQKQKFETEEKTAGKDRRIKVTKARDELVSKLTPEERRERAKQAAQAALTGVLSSHQDVLSQILGAGGESGTLGMSGIKVIGSRGPGGLLSTLDPFGGTLGGGSGGFRGMPGVLGGSASDFGAANLKTISGLDKQEASARPRLNLQTSTKPVVYSGSYDVKGALDKETVRRYIVRRLDQIRWCYQREVQKNPKISGDLVMMWIISPTGRVIRVQAVAGSIKSNSLIECVVTRIKTWRFPAPRGGAAARVTYPFIFRVVR